MSETKITMVCHSQRGAQCLNAISDWVADYFTHNSEPLVITAQTKPKKRTDAQNRFLWPMLREIARVLQERSGEEFTADDMHDYFLARFIGMEHRLVLGERIPTLPKTSEMHVKQLSYFIDRIMEWCADKDIYPMQPADYQDWAANA